RDAPIRSGLAGHRKCRSWEAGVDRSAARADILALPAPAHARDDRRLRALPAHRPAEASSRDGHGYSRQRKGKFGSRSYVRKEDGRKCRRCTVPGSLMSPARKRRTSTRTDTKSTHGFTDEERTALKDRVQELK